jgi:repressor LexA
MLKKPSAAFSATPLARRDSESPQALVQIAGWKGLTPAQAYTNICLVQELTSRQEQVLRFIEDHTERSGFPPSVRDIGEQFGLNPATVHDHIKALERKGHLLRRPHRSRSLVVVNRKPRDIAPESTEDPGVPIVGRVAAGEPILARENIEDMVHFPGGWAPAGSFLLRVQGDSMQDDHILDGDYVLIRPQKTATNGEIVVALIEDEATVKRFYRTRERIELRPANEAYEPIRIDESEGTTFALVGTVVGVLRI